MTTFWEHPDYTLSKKDWTLYRDLYSGDRLKITSAEYLWYTLLERKMPPDDQERSRIAQIRSDRETRTRYLNIPEMIVSIWQSIFFRQQPIFNSEAIAFFESLPVDKNIDGNGKSFYTFIKDCVAQDLFVYGKSIVLADAFDYRATSRGEEQAKGMRPFLEILHPLDVPDWEIETSDPKRIGKYNMLRHEYDLVVPRNGEASIKPEIMRWSVVHQSDGQTHTITRYLTEIDSSGNYKKLDKETLGAVWEQYDEPIQTSMSEIPVSVVSGQSWIKEVCEETLRHYNLRSIKDSTEFNQGLQRIWVRGVDTSNTQAISALSEHIIGALPENGGIEVVDPVPTGDLKESVNEALESAFKVGLNQQRRLPASSNQAQAANSLAEEKDPTIALVESQIDEIEVTVNEAFRFFAEFAGVANFKGYITLVKDVKRDDLDRWLKIWTTFRDDFNKIPSVKKAALKKALSNLDLDESDELFNDLETVDLGTEDPGLDRVSLLNSIANGR